METDFQLTHSDVEAEILARAYALILSWPERSQKDTADSDVVAGSGSAASDARPSGVEH